MKQRFIMVILTLIIVTLLVGCSANTENNKVSKVSSSNEEMTLSSLAKITTDQQADTEPVDQTKAVSKPSTTKTLAETNNTTDELTESIRFEDKAFETLIRSMYDLPAGEITVSDLSDIEEFVISYYDYENEKLYTEVEVDGEGISLSELKWFKNLKKISVDYINNDSPFIFDLSDLKGLNRLEHLSLRGQGFSGDLADLSQLKELKYLVLDSAVFSGDLDDLSKLNQLEWLYLYGDTFTGNLNSLNDLKAIYYLYIGGIHFEGDLKSLSSLNRLSNLNLSGDGFVGDISSLTSIKQLEKVFLFCFNVSGFLKTIDLRFHLLDDEPVGFQRFGFQQELNSAAIELIDQFDNVIFKTFYVIQNRVTHVF